MTSAAGKAIEVRGKTIEVAIEKGLAELGLARNNVEIEVIRPGSRGVLGIGAEDAVVSLMPRLAAPAAKRAPVRYSQPAREVEQAAKEETLPEAEPVRAAAPRPADQTPAKPVAKTHAKPAAKPAAKTHAKPAAKPAEKNDEEAAALARDLLAELLTLLGVDAQVVLRYSEDEEGGEPVLILDVVGQDLGILIGRRGETLAALQFVLRLMVNNHIRRWMNLVVDVEGYKARRESMLIELAQRMAERAVGSGRAVALEAMPASERRIVHITLRDHPDVTTQSVGEGDDRKVTIIPR